jgi:tetratricopeptide (TPR) repeat protein
MSGGLPATPSPGGYGGYGDGGAGGEFDELGGGGAPPPPRPDAGEFDPMAGAALFGGGSGAPPAAGGELDLEGGAMPGPSGAIAPAPIPVARASKDIGGGLPQKRSAVPKIAGVVLGLVVATGVTLSFTKLGPFGAYAIMDSVNAGSNEAALGTLRKTAQSLLDGDTSSGATKAIAAAKEAHQSAPRHKDTAAYAAYLMYSRSLRFGTDGPIEAAGAALLDPIPAEDKSDMLTLARAAKDAATAQLARAKQAVGPLAGKDVDAATLLGEIELLSKSDKVVETWDRAVKLSKSPRTLFGLARAQFATKKTKEAEATAKQVLEASPKHVASRNLLARIALADPARDAEVVGLLAKVVDDKDVRSDASDAELVESYTLLGLTHLDRSRMSQAEQAFAAALKADPQAVEALVGNGELFYKQGRYSEAQARFEAASRADADSLPAKIGVAKTYIALERTKEAKDQLKKMKEAHPKEPRVAHWLGRAEIGLGNRKEAQALYEEAIKLAGTDPVAVESFVALSALLTSFGRTDEASKKLDEAAKLFPELPALYRARGDVALQAGRYDKAREEYERALKKREDLATRFQLGITYRRMRLFDEAARSTRTSRSSAASTSSRPARPTRRSRCTATRWARPRTTSTSSSASRRRRSPRGTPRRRRRPCARSSRSARRAPRRTTSTVARSSRRDRTRARRSTTSRRPCSSIRTARSSISTSPSRRTRSGSPAAPRPPSPAPSSSTPRWPTPTGSAAS